MSHAFVPLPVDEVRRETDDACTLVFAPPPEVAQRFIGVAGQHLVLRLEVGGQEYRRAYSLSSCPEAGELPAVTVKRVDGGVVSNHLNDTVAVGQMIDAQPPAGHFCAQARPEGYRTLYLLAAGSGITPIMSNLKAILHQERDSVVNLFYGNHTPSDIIFADELDRLSAEYPGRLRIVHALSGRGGKRGVWTDGGRTYRGGRIDGAALTWFFATYPPGPQDVTYLISGPPAMISSIQDTLIGLGVRDQDILIERFTAPDADEDPTTVVADASVTARYAGQTFNATVAYGESMLDALRAVGADIPFACQSGVCGSCRGTLTRGEVHQRTVFALSADEIARGEVLLCQSRPTADVVSVEVG